MWLMLRLPHHVRGMLCLHHCLMKLRGRESISLGNFVARRTWTVGRGSHIWRKSILGLMSRMSHRLLSHHLLSHHLLMHELLLKFDFLDF
jgi:hypothetical protein